MKTVIRITIQAIRIKLPEKVWMATQQQSDSNPSSTDSNPNSSKEYFDGLIRITNQVIRIPGEEQVKLRVTDSNHPYNDLNPSWRTSDEIEARIQITHTVIRIHHEKQDKTIQIFEVRIRITFLNKVKGWKSDRAIRIIELLIRITPLV